MCALPARAAALLRAVERQAAPRPASRCRPGRTRRPRARGTTDERTEPNEPLNVNEPLNLRTSERQNRHMAKKALITGVTGQDGSYLAELLLDKGYEVTGVVRRLSAPNVWRIQHLLDRITLLQADLLDQLSLIKAVEVVRAGRVLQPRGDVVRAGVVGSADADRRVQRAGRDSRARGDSAASTRRSASIRHRPARCTGGSAKCRRPR